VTHSIHQFPLHFPSCVSQCAITFQMESTNMCLHCHVIPNDTFKNLPTKLSGLIHTKKYLQHLTIIVQLPDTSSHLICQGYFILSHTQQFLQHTVNSKIHKTVAHYHSCTVSEPCIQKTPIECPRHCKWSLPSPSQHTHKSVR